MSDKASFNDEEGGLGRPDFSGIDDGAQHPDAGTTPQAQGQTRESEPGVQMTAAILKGAAQLVCSIIAKKRGDHWLLPDDQAGEFGMSCAMVIDKYAPNFAAGPEMRLGVACLVIFGGRLMADSAIAKEQEVKAETNGQQEAHSDAGQANRPEATEQA